MKVFAQVIGTGMNGFIRNCANQEEVDKWVRIGIRIGCEMVVMKKD